MRLIARVPLTALALAAALAGGSPTGADAKSPPSGPDALQRYAGKWESDGDFTRTPYSLATHVTGSTSCAWSPMRSSLVCDQDVRTSKGEQRDTALYAFDPQANAYRYAEFPFDGSPPHITSLTILGDTWSYTGGFGNGKATVIFRTTDVFAGDTQKWRVEFSLDNGKKWIQMGAGSAKRTGN